MMRTPLVKLLLLNVLIFIFILLAYTFTGFAMGLAANSSLIPQQISLFIKFAGFHLLVSIMLWYRMKVTGWMGLAISIAFVLLLYLATAKRFDFI
ncbi:MAG TPA: hypothetical protein VL832_04220 [Puia sp.]|jgi:hypothetical protein|nr:hypothetical protein [Puia sp.]